jgi:hypothetical protein
VLGFVEYNYEMYLFGIKTQREHHTGVNLGPNADALNEWHYPIDGCFYEGKLRGTLLM